MPTNSSGSQVPYPEHGVGSSGEQVPSYASSMSPTKVSTIIYYSVFIVSGSIVKAVAAFSVLVCPGGYITLMVFDI